MAFEIYTFGSNGFFELLKGQGKTFWAEKSTAGLFNTLQIFVGSPSPSCWSPGLHDEELMLGYVPLGDQGEARCCFGLTAGKWQSRLGKAD